MSPLGRGAARARRGASIDLDRSIPGWVLHVTLGLLLVAGMLVTMLGAGIEPVLVGFLVAGVVAGTVGNARRPGYGLAAVALGLVMLPFLFTSPAGWTWRTPVLLVVVHAGVRLSWMATVAGLSTRVDTAVLALECRRSGALNLVGQLVALVAGAVTAAAGAASSLTWPWFGVLGGAAALALALLLRHGLPTRADTLTRSA